MTSKELKAAAFAWLGKDAEEMKKSLGWTEFTRWPEEGGGTGLFLLTPVYEPDNRGTLAFFGIDNTGKIVDIAWGGPGEYEWVVL